MCHDDTWQEMTEKRDDYGFLNYEAPRNIFCWHEQNSKNAFFDISNSFLLDNTV